jgi:hypothetical protein
MKQKELFLNPFLDTSFDSISISEDENGFLHFNLNIMKEGILPYSKLETGANKDFYAHVSAEELKKSVESFKQAALTKKHPSNIISKDNVQKLLIGNLGENVSFDESTRWLKSNAILRTNEAIDKVQLVIEERKKGVDANIYTSACYNREPKVESGYFEGKKYDVNFLDIKANHVALFCDNPRAGKGAKVSFDEKGKIFFLSDAIKTNKEKKNMTVIKETLKTFKVGEYSFDSLGLEFEEEFKPVMTQVLSRCEKLEDALKVTTTSLDEKSGKIKVLEKSLQEREKKSENMVSKDEIETKLEELIEVKAMASFLKISTDSIDIEKLKEVIVKKQHPDLLLGKNEVEGAYKAVLSSLKESTDDFYSNLSLSDLKKNKWDKTSQDNYEKHLKGTESSIPSVSQIIDNQI